MKNYTKEELERLNGRDGYIFPFFLHSILSKMEYDEEGRTMVAIRKYVESGQRPSLESHYVAGNFALDQFIDFYDKKSIAWLKKSDQNKINGARSHENRKANRDPNQHPIYPN